VGGSEGRIVRAGPAGGDEGGLILVEELRLAGRIGRLSRADGDRVAVSVDVQRATALPYVGIENVEGGIVEPG